MVLARLMVVDYWMFLLKVETVRARTITGWEGKRRERGLRTNPSLFEGGFNINVGCVMRIPRKGIGCSLP